MLDLGLDIGPYRVKEEAKPIRPLIINVSIQPHPSTAIDFDKRFGPDALRNDILADSSHERPLASRMP